MYRTSYIQLRFWALSSYTVQLYVRPGSDRQQLCPPEYLNLQPPAGYATISPHHGNSGLSLNMIQFARWAECQGVQLREPTGLLLSLGVMYPPVLEVQVLLGVFALVWIWKHCVKLISLLSFECFLFFVSFIFIIIMSLGHLLLAGRYFLKVDVKP